MISDRSSNIDVFRFIIYVLYSRTDYSVFGKCQELVRVFLHNSISNNMNCENCGKILTGRQSKFCSKKCKGQLACSSKKMYECQKSRQQERKLFFVAQLGGECSICKYKNNLSGLEFHHINPENKKFNLGLPTFSHKPMKVLQEEVSKCLLLCANCHREHHFPNYNNFNSIEETGYINQVIKDDKIYTKCIICEKMLDGNQTKFCSLKCRNAINSKTHQQYCNQKFKYVKRKKELMQIIGDKCSCCGYNKNLSALEFHHSNPETKKFQLDARKLANSKFSDCLEEAKKCIVICANCHREHHNDHLKLKELRK